MPILLRYAKNVTIITTARTETKRAETQNSNTSHNFFSHEQSKIYALIDRKRTGYKTRFGAA